MTPWELNKSAVAKTIPSMRYVSGDIGEWRSATESKLAELLGMDTFTKVSPELEIEFDKITDERREIRFTFKSEENYRVPCHLCIPLGAEKPLPVVICLQGHSTGMHISLGNPKYPGDAQTISGGDRDFCVRVVKEGWCALAVEQRNFGECGGTEKGPDCLMGSLTSIIRGRTTIGERVWDVMRAIDVLEESFADIVGSSDIVCMGNSGGGTSTFYIGCLDKRIKCTMPSCAFCSYDDSIIAMRHCSCNYIPGARRCFDMGDLAGLIAPRGFIVVAGREDSIFPFKGVATQFCIASDLYNRQGASDKLALVVGNGGHRFYADDAWKVYREMYKL